MIYMAQAMPGSPRPEIRRKRQGSPHPGARRRRQGSPHPNAIQGGLLGSGSASPSKPSSAAPSPPAGPQIIPDNIPDLISITPAIFVPATYDYTQPRSSPAGADATTREDGTGSTAARVDRAMAELEDHMTAVKRNIATMVLQQARKIHRDAAAAELQHASQNGGLPPRSRRLPPTQSDEEALVRSLEEPRDPRRAYGLPPDFGWASVPPVGPDPRDTPREAAVTRFAELMRFAAMQMEGYEMHCEGVRKEKKAQVAKDVAEELARDLARPSSPQAEMPAATTTTTTTEEEVDDFGIPMNIDME
ncbi:hypothetical protein BKA67DRAFT_540888 [Truncatella angustata]|uniref:Uncharacterized protein n=1 Tax=Truncatella angustata TaxID=152316 RepID=A0A9P8UBV2_9PEZI|nr:uncharacterized protein BKA67DRAFT_540888 [Truncatella angustata]KAH6645891.1 hypothetical protein BKA67DRAFT_540888 [Truncatella angustata]